VLVEHVGAILPEGPTTFIGARVIHQVDDLAPGLCGCAARSGGTGPDGFVHGFYTEPLKDGPTASDRQRACRPDGGRQTIDALRPRHAATRWACPPGAPLSFEISSAGRRTSLGVVVDDPARTGNRLLRGRAASDHLDCVVVDLPDRIARLVESRPRLLWSEMPPTLNRRSRRALLDGRPYPRTFSGRPEWGGGVMKLLAEVRSTPVIESQPIDSMYWTRPQSDEQLVPRVPCLEAAPEWRSDRRPTL